MIVKQKNLRVFHITVSSKEDFLDYLKKNKILLMEFFLLIDGEVDESIEKILEKEGMCYKNISTCKLKLSSVKKELAPLAPKQVEQKEMILEEPISKDKLKIYERPIRSGEEINEELPVVVFGRINSGANLFCTQSVSIYGIIDGLVQCDGEYIVLHGLSQRGNLIFNGEIIERELLQDNVLQKITLKNNTIDIIKV
ncbi:MAG TPA: septum site-determining protein MinC [Sulfurospirillum arcachonense]|nr:septum site-determining protein MinC [Sulfurospirillum arcachonense]HIP45637.1 septum site-determining protein MinC [Sulfurospirillum arcachonense]